MAFERDPNDPNRINRDEELRRRQRLDNELQADPELMEGPASGGRIALFAIAILAVLGVVFYGLNNSSTNPTSTVQTPPATTSSTAAQNAPKTMTPNMNTAPGQTTGAAQRAMPSAPSPTTDQTTDSGDR